jgi:hypothetical protein
MDRSDEAELFGRANGGGRRSFADPDHRQPPPSLTSAFDNMNLPSPYAEPERYKDVLCWSS